MKVLWLRRSLWLAGFACLWLNVHDDPPLRTDAYLLDVTATAATIGLVTAADASVVATVRDRESAVVTRVAGVGMRRRHALRVEGLRPDRSYDYEVEVDGSVGHRGHIHTAPVVDAAPVRFAFLGDSGDQPWWVWLQHTSLLHWPGRWGWFADSDAVTRVGAAVAGFGPAFVVHLGDVVYPRGLHAHYRSGFFRPFAAALANAPFYAVLGNHDVMDTGGLQALANLRGPRSPSAGSAGARHFSFAWGPVRVIGLDCNTDYSGDRYERGHPADEFLRAELARCTEPWIVVASHFPMRSASRQRDRGELLLSLLPELVDGQISLYLSGHDHCYQRFGEPGGDEPVLVVSGGGDTYVVVVATGTGDG